MHTHRVSKFVQLLYETPCRGGGEGRACRINITTVCKMRLRPRLRARVLVTIHRGREEEQACPMGHYGVITAYRNAGQNCKTKSGKNSGEKLT